MVCSINHNTYQDSGLQSQKSHMITCDLTKTKRKKCGNKQEPQHATWKIHTVQVEVNDGHLGTLLKSPEIPSQNTGRSGQVSHASFIHACIRVPYSAPCLFGYIVFMSVANLDNVDKFTLHTPQTTGQSFKACDNKKEQKSGQKQGN